MSVWWLCFFRDLMAHLGCLDPRNLDGCPEEPHFLISSLEFSLSSGLAGFVPSSQSCTLWAAKGKPLQR